MYRCIIVADNLDKPKYNDTVASDSAVPKCSDCLTTYVGIQLLNALIKKLLAALPIMLSTKVLHRMTFTKSVQKARRPCSEVGASMSKNRKLALSDSIETAFSVEN